MTREEALKLLPVIQAFANGEEVQWMWRDDVWRDHENPEFGSAVNWRIKPKPREVWVAYGDDGRLLWASSENVAIPMKTTAVKFREVLD